MRSRVEKFVSRLRYQLPARLFPKLARISLKYATRQARRTLSAEHPLKILLDNTVLDIAVTHETKWITTDVQTIGDYVHHAGHLARVPVYGFKNTSERHKQATYLPGLSHLASLGLAKLFTSAELKDEQFRQPMGRYRGYGLFDRSLFADVEIVSVDGHVFPTLGPCWMNLPRVQDQQRSRIRKKADPLFDSLYQVLSKQLGPKCNQDCWHIRTAEIHDCFAFLTTDGPLLKAWASLAHKPPLKNLKTKVLSPSQLGELLALRPVSPILLSYEGRDALVRVDTTMPGETRRPVGKYKRP